MASAKPEGVWRTLQLLLSPFAFAAKAAIAVILILAVIAAGLIWAVDAMIPRARQRPQRSAEVHQPVTIRAFDVRQTLSPSTRDQIEPHLGR